MVLEAAAMAGFRSARRSIAQEDWGRILAVALFGNPGLAVLFAVAKKELDPAIAGMITSGTPMMGLVIAAFLMRRLPGRAQTIGISLGLLGIIMMASPSMKGPDAAPIGLGLVILAVVG